VLDILPVDREFFPEIPAEAKAIAFWAIRDQGWQFELHNTLDAQSWASKIEAETYDQDNPSEEDVRRRHRERMALLEKQIAEFQAHADEFTEYDKRIYRQANALCVCLDYGWLNDGGYEACTERGKP
jgi:hypothetical protein